jgi:predicted transcriptional regulator
MRRNSKTGEAKTRVTSVKLSPTACALLLEIADIRGRSPNASIEDAILAQAEELGLYKGREVI